MSRISVKDAVKRYGNNTVIPDLNLEIGDGELFTLLGPSGCGKTTLLRMIAGFNSIEGGDIFFNEKRINDMDPSKRNIGMVFQNYAIFPHYTVRKNVEFGLKNKKFPKDKIKTQSEKFMKLMQIDQYAARLCGLAAAGGTKQREKLALSNVKAQIGNDDIVTVLFKSVFYDDLFTHLCSLLYICCILFDFVYLHHPARSHKRQTIAHKG